MERRRFRKSCRGLLTSEYEDLFDLDLQGCCECEANVLDSLNVSLELPTKAMS